MEVIRDGMLANITCLFISTPPPSPLFRLVFNRTHTEPLVTVKYSHGICYFLIELIFRII